MSLEDAAARMSARADHAIVQGVEAATTAAEKRELLREFVAKAAELRDPVPLTYEVEVKKLLGTKIERRELDHPGWLIPLQIDSGTLKPTSWAILSTEGELYTAREAYTPESAAKSYPPGQPLLITPESKNFSFFLQGKSPEPITDSRLKLLWIEDRMLEGRIPSLGLASALGYWLSRGGDPFA